MPKVELIDYTGAGNADPWHAARMLIYAKSTRLEQNFETRTKINNMNEAELLSQLDAVARSVRTSWEFVSYTWQISDVTRAFTHQLVRTRYGVSFAQQAQRVADMSKFATRIPNTVNSQGHSSLWKLTVDMIASSYATLQKAGIPNQDCRGLLPTNVLTNILARFDLRALADMAGKRDNLRAQDEYGEVAKAMKETVYEVHPWAKAFIEPERKNTPALDTILARLLGTDSPVDHPDINAALKELDALKGTWG